MVRLFLKLASKLVRREITLHAGLTMIIARQITSNLKIRPNVRNTYKTVNIWIMA